MSYCKTAPPPRPPPPPHLPWRLRAAVKLHNLGVLAEREGTAYQSEHDYLTGVYYRDKGRGLKRRKSLSRTESDDDGKRGIVGRLRRGRKKECQDQAASALFSKLPREVRDRIYGFALTTGTGVVMIGYDAGRLQTRVCSAMLASSVSPCDEVAAQPWLGSSLLALLCTCRAVYTEALPVLYAGTQFVFDEYAPYEGWSCITPAGHLRLVRSVRVNQYWSAAGEAALRSRWYKSSARYGRPRLGDPDIEALRPRRDLLRMMRELSHVRRFYVVLKVDRGGMEDPDRDVRHVYVEYAQRLREAAFRGCMVRFCVVRDGWKTLGFGDEVEYEERFQGVRGVDDGL